MSFDLVIRNGTVFDGTGADTEPVGVGARTADGATADGTGCGVLTAGQVA